jgi:preprotein translocase subunit SecE
MTDTRPAARDERARGGKDAKLSPPARISLFYRQVVAELRKVIWPTRKELVTYTTVVIFFVCIVIAYVTVLDVGFSKVVLGIFG